jgi:hypothetical protein
MMKRVIAAGSVLAFVTLTSGATALADPNLTDVRHHRHFVETPTGDRVEVGPGVCDDPSLYDAFLQFHHNVHHSNGSSLGPQTGAPGLNNDRGAEITAGRC